MKRRERKISLTLDAVSSGMTYRCAQATFHIPKSTAWERKQKASQPDLRSRRYILTENEEQLILDLLLRFAERGNPLRRLDVREATHVIIERFPDERKQTSPFQDNIPGKKWVKGFYDRNKDVLRLGYPNPQQGKRFAVTNAEVLTSHFSALAELISMYQRDDQCVWNLDETGRAPGKDTTRASRSCRLLRRHAETDFKIG